ncbi:MAG TPA: protein tyrosine phosphatase family protein [Anaerolineales bacterium]|nr:protein tyrosine phosphatase family protein [Anaerolineales bacterium]
MKEIFNYLQLTGKLSTSGMPTHEQLSEVAEAGVEFVVNLATSKSEGWIPNEGDVLTGLGVDYLSIPVDWDNPTAENLAEFMDALDAHKDERVHVHCKANFRAMAFVTLYRILRLGREREQAFQDIRKIWKLEEHPVWQKFVNESLENASANHR